MTSPSRFAEPCLSARSRIPAAVRSIGRVLNEFFGVAGRILGFWIAYFAYFFRSFISFRTFFFKVNDDIPWKTRRTLVEPQLHEGTTRFYVHFFFPYPLIQTCFHHRTYFPWKKIFKENVEKNFSRYRKPMVINTPILCRNIRRS